MREIKFRGKRIDTGDWVFGTLTYVDDKPAIIRGSIEFIDGFELRGSNWDWVDPDTIGQYTGVKDRDETEIYEGDLLLSAGMVWEVVYNENLASFVLCTEYCIGSTPLGEMIRSFDFKISGNIVDNKDLLEKTK